MKCLHLQPLPELLFFLLSVSSLLAQSQCFHVGETSRLIRPQRVRNWRGAQVQGLQTEIWYPVSCQVQVTRHDIGPPEHPLFVGGSLAIDAHFASHPLRFPLILLSHGTGGTGDSLEWLATALAAKGYIVAAVNHPGNNARAPLTDAGFLLWWERAADLTDVLDGLLADAIIGPRIDTQHIGAAGFSLGGYSVLELAGARTTRSAFLDFCKSKKADATCSPPEMAKAEIKPATEQQESTQEQSSIERSGDSYRDSRVKAVFVMAPALGEAFGENGLKDIKIPLEIVAGQADVTVPINTNALRYSRLMPAAKLTLLPGVSHYTFTQTCLLAAIKTLPQICKDDRGVDRDEIHQKVASMAVSFFDRYL